MNRLVTEFYSADADSPSYGWIERVPCYRNVADDPSRGRPEAACSLLGLSSWETFVHPQYLLLRLANSLVKSKGEKP